MSRLLFAAARGARIEDNAFTKETPLWYPTKKWSAMHEPVLRIHPDDAHLQYGPISTAIKKNAESFDARHTSGLPYVEGYFIFTNAEADCLDADELHRSLFLLILAEALADSGL